MKSHTLHLSSALAAFCTALLIAVLIPSPAHAASATLSINPDPIFEGESATVTWSSSETFKCVGTGFSTGGATSGSVTVKPSSTGVKTYSVLCYVTSPACTLQQTGSFTEDAPGVNTCSDITRPDGAGCYPNGAQCMTSTKKTASTWTLKEYQCTGSCTTVSASDTVTVNTAPPPAEPGVTVAATPSTVTEGGSALIEWSGTGVTTCDGTNFSTGGNVSGSDTRTPTGNTTYSISCDGKVFSTAPGVWQPAGTDYTDYACTRTPRKTGDFYLDNECPSSDPEGLSCNGSDSCAVNTWQTKFKDEEKQYCTLVSDLYQCNGGTTPTKINASASITYNRRPAVPTISGPTSGTAGTSYSFSFQASDPDGDKVRYRIDWDNNGSADQILPATGYVDSNTSQSAPRSWGTPGSYTLKASTQDNRSARSGWTSHTIVVSESKAPLSVTCSASPASISVNESSTWGANPTGGTGSYTYSWSGTDGLSGSTQNISKTYTTTGTKTASVTVSDGEASKAISCSNSVTISPGGSGAACSNGLDDDNDTFKDAEDTGCGNPYNPNDTTESPNPQCSDGIDNNDTDNDPNTFKDFGGSSPDPLCQSPYDDSEFITDAEQPQLSIDAQPTRVQQQKTTTLIWSASNVQAGFCRVTSNVNTDSWTGASGTQTTSPIVGETRYTLQCKNLSGVNVLRSVIITIAPTVTED